LAKAKKFVLCLNYSYLSGGAPKLVVLVSAPVQPDNVALLVDSAAQELLTVRDLTVNSIMGQLAMESRCSDNCQNEKYLLKSSPQHPTTWIVYPQRPSSALGQSSLWFDIIL
jgi:hypothetical protein